MIKHKLRRSTYGQCTPRICRKETGLCSKGKGVKAWDQALSRNRSRRSSCADPLWCGECVGWDLSEGIADCIFWASCWRYLWRKFWRRKRKSILRWVPSGTVRSESRFCGTVCEASEWGRGAGNPQRNHICDRRKHLRRRAWGNQEILYQPGRFQRNRNGEAADTRTGVWWSCRCRNLWRLYRYAGGQAERALYITQSCYDIQGFLTYPELLQEWGEAQSVHDWDPRSRHLLEWSLPPHHILNRA